MTGTDYNAIVNELNQSSPVRPKGQPDRTHIAGLNQSRLKMRTGNGDDAHLWPAKHYRGDLVSESEKNMNKHRTRNALINRRKKEAAIEDAIKPLSEIFTG